MNVDVRIGYLESELEESQIETRRWRRLALAAVMACALLLVALAKGGVL